MNKIKKFSCFVMMVLFMFSLVGCSFAASFATIPLNFENGDKLNAKMSSGEHNYKMTFDENDDNALRLYEGDKCVLLCSVRDETMMDNYVQTVIYAAENNVQNMEFVGSGELNGIKYTTISFVQDGETVHEMIGWIIGSNLGFLADVHGSEKDMMEIMSCIKFEVKETRQSDSSFYYENIDGIASSHS